MKNEKLEEDYSWNCILTEIFVLKGSFSFYSSEGIKDVNQLPANNKSLI